MSVLTRSGLLVGTLLLAAACGAESVGAPEADVDASASADVPTSTSPDVEAPAAAVPHVLLVIADDFGVDSTLSYADDDGDGIADDGREYAPIPNIDGLCRAGVRFDAAWSYPLCSPTRAAMLTGRFGFRTGVGAAVSGGNAIQTDELTLPTLLGQLQPALQAANIGKWHLGTTAKLGGDLAPNTMGWPHFSGSLAGALPSYTEWSRTVDGETDPVDGYA